MARLAGMSTYLCGSMDYAHDGGEGWRNMVKLPLRKMGILVVDPCDKPIVGEFRDEFSARQDMDNMKQEGRYDEIKPKYGDSVRGFDLHCVDVTTFTLVNLHKDTPTFGSPEEYFWANRCKKPVLFHFEGRKKHEIPNWFFMSMPHELLFGDDWNDVFKYLDYVNTSPKIDTLGRWRFIDWSRVIQETEKVYGPL